MERRRVGEQRFEVRCKQGNEHKQEGKEIRLRNSQGFEQPNPCEIGRQSEAGRPSHYAGPREANSRGGSNERRVAVIHKCTSR